MVVCLPRHMEGMGDSNFHIFIELPVPPEELESKYLLCFSLYIILSTTVSFLDLKVTLHVCYVFNVIWRIILVIDGFNVV